jgi:hypothetical protein
MENIFETKIKDKMPVFQERIIKLHRELCKPEISEEFLKYLDECKSWEGAYNYYGKTPRTDELIEKYMETHRKKE